MKKGYANIIIAKPFTVVSDQKSLITEVSQIKFNLLLILLAAVKMQELLSFQ